jgi:two-component system nitrogen regulation response regulator GlnG
MKRAMVLSTSSVILPQHLPDSIRGGIKEENDTDILRRLVERKARALFSNAQSEGTGEIYHIILNEIERFLLQVILDETDGNQLRTADLLGINRNTLRKKIRMLGVEVRRTTRSDVTSPLSMQEQWQEDGSSC